MPTIEEVLKVLDFRTKEESDYRSSAAEAYRNLRSVADELERDPSGTSLRFFETFGSVRLFEYDGREDLNHGIFYSLDKEKIIIRVGKEVADQERFLGLFTIDSQREMDFQARGSFLKKITYDEIIRVLLEFQVR